MPLPIRYVPSTVVRRVRWRDRDHLAAAIDPSLRGAYATCRRLHLRHDPTYYMATRRLPPQVRPAVHALYGYVRSADQLVDAPRGCTPPAERRMALERWEAALLDGLDTGGSTDPIVAALVDAGRRHDLPLRELCTYMHSMRVDCDRVRIASDADLEAYMNGSAAAVGRIVAPLLGVPAGLHEEVAQLAVGFQLANFVRDVREDYALDRIYLPASARRRHGVSGEELGRERASSGVRGLVAEYVARARARLSLAGRVQNAANPEMRGGVTFACEVYGAMLDNIEASRFDVLRRRPRPPAAGVGAAMLAARDQRSMNGATINGRGRPVRGAAARLRPERARREPVR